MYRYLLVQLCIFFMLMVSACSFNDEKELSNKNELSAEKQPLESPFLRLSTNQDGSQSSDQPANGQRSHLPFENFIERWNALADEMAADLKITSFKEATDETGTFFQTYLRDRLELRVFTADQNIQKIQLVGLGKTKTDFFLMLTAWSQVYSIMSGDYEPHEVDLMFNELGVGPNADLENVQQKTIAYRDVLYTVNPTNNGFLFEASYPQQ